MMVTVGSQEKYRIRIWQAPPLAEHITVEDITGWDIEEDHLYLARDFGNKHIIHQMCWPRGSFYRFEVIPQGEVFRL